MKIYLVIAERKVRHIAQIEANDAVEAEKLYRDPKNWIWDDTNDTDSLEIKAVEEVKA